MLLQISPKLVIDDMHFFSQFKLSPMLAIYHIMLNEILHLVTSNISKNSDRWYPFFPLQIKLSPMLIIYDIMLNVILHLITSNISKIIYRWYDCKSNIRPFHLKLHGPMKYIFFKNENTDLHLIKYTQFTYWCKQ